MRRGRSSSYLRVITSRSCTSTRSGRVTGESHSSHLPQRGLMKDCRYRDDWATKHFLHAKTLRKAREVRTQLLDIMKHQKLEIIPCGADWDVIRYVTISTLPPEHTLMWTVCVGRLSVRRTSIKRRGSRELENTRVFELEVRPSRPLFLDHITDTYCPVPMHVHPTSAIFGAGVLPDFAVYHELISTAKSYMST